MRFRHAFALVMMTWAMLIARDYCITHSGTGFFVGVGAATVLWLVCRILWWIMVDTATPPIDQSRGEG